MTDLQNLLHVHLQFNQISSNDACAWQVQNSPLGGRGLFATKDLKANAILFIDAPLILGPRAALHTPLPCAICYSRAQPETPCTQGCGIVICSPHCEQSAKHQLECHRIRQWSAGKAISRTDTHRALTPIRSLFLNAEQKQLLATLKAHTGNQHGFEVDLLKNTLHLRIDDDEERFMRIACCVLDANAFEVVVGNDYTHCVASLRGLYPLSSLMNHDCSPNTMHLFDGGQRMIVKACRDIAKGEEITHSYARLLWGTVARRPHLMRTKHFFCCCQRCEDPTEFGTFLSALRCKKCEGYVVPIIDRTCNMVWRCRSCDQELSSEMACTIQSVLASRINNFESENVDHALKFLNQVLIKYAPPFNQIALDLKYKLIYIIGHRRGFLWHELSEQLLSEKEAICLELIEIVEKLKLGQCKLKGHVLLELLGCYRERQRRLDEGDKDKILNGDHNMKTECQELLKQSLEILDGDVFTPSLE